MVINNRICKSDKLKLIYFLFIILKLLQKSMSHQSQKDSNNSTTVLTEIKEEILHPSKELLEDKEFMKKLNYSLICYENKGGYSELDVDTTQDTIDVWIDDMRKKYPCDKVIDKLYGLSRYRHDNGYSYTELLEDIIHLDTLCMDEVEKKDSINILFLLQLHVYYRWTSKNALYTMHMGVLKSLQKIQEKQQLERKVKELEQKVKQLSKENTELLLRPEGPVSIELGKKFLQLSNTMNEMKSTDK